MNKHLDILVGKLNKKLNTDKYSLAKDGLVYKLLKNKTEVYESKAYGEFYNDLLSILVGV